MSAPSKTIVPRTPRPQETETPPEWKPRARAYEKGVYGWRFRDIPRTVPGENGAPVKNPQLDSAVFVVHGMGLQIHTETTVALKDGFENTMDWIRARHGTRRLAVPFTYEGYWANYENLKETFPDEWETFHDREQDLFERMWKRRTGSPERTLLWFMGQGLRLLHPRMILKTSFLRWISYFALAVVGVIGLLGVYVRRRRVIGEVLSDVRIYAAPRGDIERAIVQRIDHRVGAQFLQMLGVDWDLRDLPRENWIPISGEPHRFEYVTWVAHSLGSVVSYNVISDILERCREVEAEVTAKGNAGGADDAERLRNVERVRNGLHRFVTIGSPLEKFSVLYPDALRAWNPDEAARVAAGRGTWWTNFHHVWDPVSGRLRNRTCFHGLPRNLHSVLWHVPFLAHTAYWRDRPVAAYVISRAYGRKILQVGELNHMSEGWTEVVRKLSFAALWALGIAAVVTWKTWMPLAWGLVKAWIGF